MTYQIKLSEQAVLDLADIQEWIAYEAGKVISENYINRITEKFMSLQTFPLRGTLRPHLGLGIRTLSFERRVSIAYRIIKNEVWIERVQSGRRQYQLIS